MAQMPEAIILRKTEETKTGVTYCIADVKTNADRIRAMTDEELAEFLCIGDCYYCLAGDETSEKCKWDKERNIFTGMIDWLKQEAT